MRFMIFAASLVVFQQAMAEAPKPTMADVAYGPHPHQRLDFYRAESAGPAPVLFFIHGGGWMNGDKSQFNDSSRYLKAGISVVVINYRLLPEARTDGVSPPIAGPMHDAARALQFVRSKAAEWNINKERISASGSSAGACTCLWLAFHDEMSEPKSSNPVARESTRLWSVAVAKAHTSLDPLEMTAWIPNNTYGAHAFGYFGQGESAQAAYAHFTADRESLAGSIREYSPFAWTSRDDPPVYLYYLSAPAVGQEQKEPAHSANFGVKLQERLKTLGVPCELVFPGAADVRHSQMADYLIESLKSPATK